MDQKALEHDIFGSDDDDDDFVPPAHAEDGDGAAEGADADDQDDRANAILESARTNALLISKKDRKKAERKEKKDKDVGRGGKRKSKPSADEMAAEGLKREKKRLKKRHEGEAGGSGEGGGEEGEGGAAAGGDDDPDSDSVDGDQAIEEGGKGDFDRIIDGLKHKRSKQSFDRTRLVNDVRELINRMDTAAEADNEAVQKEPPEPAVYKVAMLAEVEAMMRKKHYHEVMLDESMLSTIAHWLMPLRDGSLPSLMVRKALLIALLRFDIDETALGQLRSSGIGKYVKLLTLHKKETGENRKMAQQLVEKWTRPIYQTSDKVRAEELPVANRPLSYAELPKERAEDAAAVGGALAMERKTANHARVPRPMGMDFQMLPASSAAPLPSSKYAKESNKGRLQDRILNGKRKANPQAMTLSVEGRTLDKV